MFELLRVAIALVGSAGAGLWDLKTTNIPDWVCAVMIATGLLLFGIEGAQTGDWSGLTMSVVVGGIFALFGLGMYLTGQWGGGDGELMAAIGVLLPLWPFGQMSVFPMPLAFFINVFFVGAIYTVGYAAVLACSKPTLRAAISHKVKADAHIIVPISIGVTAAVAVLWSMSGMAWLVILPLVVIAMPILYRMLNAVEKSFYVRIPASKLKVDDMLGEDIPRLKLYKKYIRGLTATEVKKIRKYRSYVMIRDGVRFGIVFHIALIVTLLVGDIVTFILPQIM
ncbi:MAG: A24 family peptidase [Candidatus Aenigmatarchaeota archaeon]|nr:A24 family peptidase [Candidatus Aenigmarchaeota archaeon]